MSLSYSYYDDYRLKSLVANNGSDAFVSAYQADPIASYPIVHTPSTTRRVQRQSFAYDWRGNLTSTTDDTTPPDFPDRSLGTINNGNAVSPDRFFSAAAPSGGTASASYDSAGNLGLIGWTDAAGAGEEYAYGWDELGHLATAVREDVDHAAETQESYVYDRDGQRVITARKDRSTGQTLYTLNVFDTLVLKDAKYVIAGIFNRCGLGRICCPVANGCDVGLKCDFTDHCVQCGAVGQQACGCGGAGQACCVSNSCSFDLGCFGGTCASCGLEGQPACPRANGHYQDDWSTANFYLSGGLVHAMWALGLPVNTNTNAGTTGVHWFLNLGDAHGSTAFVIDYQTGEVAERAAYLAYGAPDTDYRPARWGHHRASVRYGGHWDNAEVGLTYFGARYYSPLLGRFISPDPLTVHGLSGDPNPYAYAYGNPSRYADPTGLDPEGYTPSDEALAQFWSTPEYQESAQAAVQQTWDAQNWSPGDPNEVTASASDAAGGMASDFEPGGSMSDFNGLPGLAGPSFGDFAFAFGQAAQGAAAATVNVAADNLAGMMSVPGAGSFDLSAQSAALSSSLHVPVPQNFFGRIGYGGAMVGMAIFGGLGGAEEGVSLAAEGAEATASTLARTAEDIPATFIGQEAGPSIVVPSGATGPTPALNGAGVRYLGGAGGPGLDARVSGLRIMDPTARYPGGYASYSNAAGQAVNPLTGQTIAPANPWWHIVLPW